jgi:hypothetical protein
MRLFLVTSLVLVVLTIAAGPVAGQPLPRSHDTRGWMYSTALDGGDIQVSVRLCDRPQRESDCHRMSPSLQRAIEREYEGTIDWVHRMWPYRGTFFVLGPIRFGSGRAAFPYLWRETKSEGGCGGHGRVFFRRSSSGWNDVRHSGVGACPA